MTLCARDGGVTPAKRIPRAVVVEGRAVDGVEALRRMTPAAGAVHLAPMRIGVAARAIGERHRAEHGNRPPGGVDRGAQAGGDVALGARNGRVLAAERISGTRVIEFRCVLPSAGVVTARAASFAVERTTMGIGVATGAITLESHPARSRSPRRQRRHRRDTELRAVARRTLRGRVTLLERVTRPALVIEALR